jgi:hypothetical protein
MAVTKVRSKQQLEINNGVSFANFKITDLDYPTSDLDGVNKAYVDSVASGLIVKESARAATIGTETYTITANYVSQINGTSIDGVTIVAGNRILVKNAPATSGTSSTTNTNNPANGIYEVQSITGGNIILLRSPDGDVGNISAGMFLFVTEGSTNADNGFVLVTNNPITVNTTPLQFTQFSGAGQIDAGNGLTKSGNTIDAVGTTDRISISANAIDIASTYVGQNSIVTVGNITTGTWSANTIAVDKGGTGRVSATAFMPLLGGTTTTGAQQSVSLGTTNGQALLYQGASSNPSFGAINLAGGTNIVSGTLPIGNGGTGLTSTPSNGNLLIGNGTGYTQATLSAGAGISISNGAGSITISTTGVLTSSSYVTREIPSGTINGSNATFVLAFTPTSGTEMVFVNGILQNVGAGNDYTISGTTITFLSGAIPQTGDIVLVSYLK